MDQNRRLSFVCTLLTIMMSTFTFAQDFSIDSYTIDGGGGYSAGGAFELEGTIGQSDAGYMSGDGFELEGGFWPTTTIPSCSCLGDMNGDGARDGGDIQQFAACLLDGGSCQCADVDGLSGVTIDDLGAFVSDLLSGGDCP